MSGTLVTMLVSAVLKSLTPDVLKNGLGKLIDFLEQEVVKSENTVDDTLVLPLLGSLRKVVGIPKETI